METGGTQENGQPRTADEVGNVVRIPRDWFGPVDELVPFGPRATAAENESDPSSGLARNPGPPDPNSFWDESSSSIQDVVEAPVDAARGCTSGAGRGTRTRALRQAVGTRKAVACAVIAVVVGVGVAGWLLGNPARPAPISAVAALSEVQAASSPRHATGHPAAKASGRVVRVSRRLGGSRARRSRSPARSSPTVQVVYRSSPSAPAAPQTSSVASHSAAEPSSGASAASAGTPAQPSPTPYGASGALGPMSSPDG